MSHCSTSYLLHQQPKTREGSSDGVVGKAQRVVGVFGSAGCVGFNVRQAQDTVMDEPSQA